MFCRKSRWALLILFALVIVLSACGGSTTPNQPTSSAIHSPQNHKLVVVVQGIGTQLTSSDVAKNGGYGGVSGFGSVVDSLKATKEFADAQYMAFSYAQVFGLDGQPAPYDCNLTYSQSIVLDESKLAAQVTAYTTNHNNTEVYIISHSLGGVISLALLADLVENSHSLSLANGGTLKGVAILDSPIGGVIDNSAYLSGLWLKVHASFLGLGTGCNILHMGEDAYKDLTSLLKVAHDPSKLGMSASIFQSILNRGAGQYISNQTIAADAANLGARILIVGNFRDLLWQPQVCNAGRSFITTELLQEQGEQSNQGALYSRSFTTGQNKCSAVTGNAANHLDVLNRADVQIAIWETFTGQAVDQLQPVTTMPVQPTPTPTPLVIQSDPTSLIAHNVGVSQPPCHPNESSLECIIVLISPASNQRSVTWTASAIINGGVVCGVFFYTLQSGTLFPGKQVSVPVDFTCDPGTTGTITFSGAAKPLIVPWKIVD